MKLPKTYFETALYKRLESFEDKDALNKVNKMIEIVDPFMELVGHDAFDNFTIHTSKHSVNLMGYASEIIPAETLANLSSVEIMILIYAFYIHDIGMAISYKDCDNIYKSDDFKVFLESHSEYADRIEAIDKQMSSDSIQPDLDLYKKFIYQAALTEYIRPKHADIDRYKVVVDQLLKLDSTLFQYKGTSFLDELLLICHSHNCSAIMLSEKENGEKRFDPEGLLCNEKFNMQFCAAVLRICDILDFDRERAPKSLYNAIGIEDKQMPGFKISIKEWQKQMGIHTIEISDDSINVSAKCQNPNIEHAIRSLCQDVEREIRATLHELNDNKEDIVKRYKLHLPILVIPKIKSENYTYKDYSIKLNDSKIIELLMGDNLYDSPMVAARELLQNAIDACCVRKGMEEYYTPQIKVYFRKDGESTWLVVSDNGIGMDEYVLSNYFLKVGASYYSSSEFKSISIKNKFSDFEPISRFGIGFLSVFMIGDVVKVQTRNKYSKYNTKGKVLYVDNSGSLAIVREEETVAQGTIVEVKLKKDFNTEGYLYKIAGHIKEFFIRPTIPIDIDIEGKTNHIDSKGFLTLKSGTEEKLIQSKIHTVSVNFSEYSSIISGFAYFFFFENNPGEWNYYDTNSKYIWDKDFLRKEVLFDNIDYLNQATVNGIKMNVSKIGSLYNYKKKIMPYVIDINVISTNQIVFDVSRSKVIGKGLEFLRNEILRIVQVDLDKKGITSKLSPETRIRFYRAKMRYEERQALDEKMMKEVEKYCPEGKFNANSHLIRFIAREMEVDSNSINRYIYVISKRRQDITD